jgi:NAD(P)-dependent dehydrogenase (short-subunit alcohol dehydrogenase family)
VKDLKGRVAVITGAGGGFGLAMARGFAAEGMSIVAADVDAAALESAVDELASSGVEVIGVPTDVTDYDSVEALAATSLDRFGQVDVVCNNAGVAAPGGLLETGMDAFRWVLDVNLYGVVHGIKAFVPHMVERDAGHVVNTASVSGLLSQPGLAAYNVSKFGVVALSESLFYELDMLESAVGVSVVCPAWTPTRILEPERLLPIGVEVPAGPVTERVRAGSQRLMDASRRSADDVAASVVAAVKENRFYVLTHRGILSFVRRRHEDIELARNPSVPHGT